MTTNKEQADVEKYFNALGYTLHEIKDSVFREEKSTFVFQTDNKNHTVDGSTILYDHAVKIHQAVAEDRARVMEELDQQVMWYNTNNQIPESELSKGQEHWDMIRKAIKDSLQEVQSRIKNSLNKPTTL